MNTALQRMRLSATKIKPFVRTITENTHFRSAVYAVHGFWSGDSVRVLQSKRDRSESYPSAWEEPRINWSCGGEDFKAEPDRTIASECFAFALKDAVKLARRWKPKAQPTKACTHFSIIS